MERWGRKRRCGLRRELGTVCLFGGLLRWFSLFAAPMACGSPWARDQTRAAAVITLHPEPAAPQENTCFESFEKPHTVFHCGCPSLHSQQVYEGSPFSTS